MTFNHDSQYAPGVYLVVLNFPNYLHEWGTLCDGLCKWNKPLERFLILKMEKSDLFLQAGKWNMKNRQLWEADLVDRSLWKTTFVAVSDLGMPLEDYTRTLYVPLIGTNQSYVFKIF